MVERDVAQIRCDIEVKERAKRRRLEEEEAERNKRAAEREASKEARAAEKATAKAARDRAAGAKRQQKAREEETKARFIEIRQALRRSGVHCTCKLPIHTDKCRIRGPDGAVLYWGADMRLSRAAVEWYLSQPGARSYMCCCVCVSTTQNVYSAHSFLIVFA